MKKHINIPIFIPHLGCPNMCVFCNQRTISGVPSFDIVSVEKTIQETLSTLNGDEDVEIAFFGGSFTGIDRQLMISLLKIANKYISLGKVTSIRCSTRPDYINEEILEILKEYSVRVIELGLQSTDDQVLEACKRGHSFIEEKKASDLILRHGFILGGQMMIGLPESNIELELKTADFIISSGAKVARIYPTVVFRDTELCDMCKNGKYTPLNEQDAVERSAKVFLRLVSAGIKVIRIGLCSSENLSSSNTYYAGPNHPALGELVLNKVYYDIICEELLKDNFKFKTPTIYVAKGAISKAIGQNKKNKNALIEKFSLKDIRFKEDDTIREYNIKVYCEER